MKYLIIALLFTATLSAQDKTLLAQEKSELALAVKLREESALEVREKKTAPEASLAKLKAHNSPAGLKIDRDAEFALAAIDVGQRLIASGEPEAAVKFFREAEKSLSQLIKKTPDSAAQTKAAYLQKLAFLRSRFLNRPKEAKADLDAALVLRPNDQQLKKEKERLVIEHGPSYSDNSPKG